MENERKHVCWCVLGGVVVVVVDWVGLTTTQKHSTSTLGLGPCICIMFHLRLGL